MAQSNYTTAPGIFQFPTNPSGQNNWVEGIKISYPTVIPPISVEALQWKYRFLRSFEWDCSGGIIPMYFVLPELCGKD